MLNISAIVNAIGNVNEYVKKDQEGNLSNSDALKILFKDHELSMSNGNIFKFLKKFIVQPTIFISKDLEGTPYEKDAINAQINIFSAFYIQAIKIMTDHYGISSIDAINLLKTDKGEFGNAVVANAARIIDYAEKSTEDDIDRKLKNFAGYSTSKFIRNLTDKVEASKIRQENDQKLANALSENQIVDEVMKECASLNMKTESDEVYELLKESNLLQMNREQLNMLKDSMREEASFGKNKKSNNNGGGGNGGNSKGVTNEQLNKAILSTNRNIANTAKAVDINADKVQKEITSLSRLVRENKKENRVQILKEFTSVKNAASNEILSEANKSPTYNFFIRNFDLEVKVSYSDDGKVKTMSTAVLPITIHAHILYVDAATIDSHISSSHSNDDNSIFAQWNDYRVGVKSFWDVMFANTLVKNYRKNLIKDTKGLLSEMEQHNKNAKLRLLTTGKAQGFEKYYNLFILSLDTINNLSKKVGDMKNPSAKDKFMEMLGSQQLLVMDYEYELYYLYLLSIDGESKGKLSSMGKMEKKNNNDDILSALLANTVPRI